MSVGTDIPDWLWHARGIPEPRREYAFWPGRRFRIDYAWLIQMVAVEIEGGSWIQGRHTRGKGYQSDMTKYNRLALDGWLLLRYTPQKIDYDEISRALITRTR